MEKEARGTTDGEMSDETSGEVRGGDDDDHDDEGDEGDDDDDDDEHGGDHIDSEVDGVGVAKDNDDRGEPNESKEQQQLAAGE